MKPITRVREHDDKERGLIAFRLNEAPFRVSFASPYRKDDIILVKPFEDKVKPTLYYGGIYLSQLNTSDYTLEKLSEADPKEWRGGNGVHYTTLIAGYEHTTPIHDLVIIGELFGVKDDRPIKLIQSGFVNGNPFKRLNYRFEDRHGAEHYERFLDVCRGSIALDENVISIYKKVLKGE